MSNMEISLKPVDGIEIITLMDNYIDVLLPNKGPVTRPPLAQEGKIPTDTFLAEHGLSLLIRVNLGNDTHVVLLDTGYSSIGVPHNMRLMGIEPDGIEAIILTRSSCKNRLNNGHNILIYR